MTSEEAMALALDWAEGRRSHTNLGPHEPYTPEVIAVMDAQEVVKWSALAVALAQVGAVPSEEDDERRHGVWWLEVFRELGPEGYVFGWQLVRKREVVMVSRERWPSSDAAVVAANVESVYIRDVELRV